jgi:hypothetical protein
VLSSTIRVVCAQEINDRSPYNFEHFLSFDNYSEIQKPEGFFSSSSSSERLRNDFVDIVLTQLDSWDKPKQYMMRSDSWVTLLKIDPYLLEGKLIVEGESPTARLMTSIQLLDFNIKIRCQDFMLGTWRKFDMVLSTYMNDEFDEEPVTDLASDKEGVEIWLNRSFGLFKVNTFYRDQWNNADFVLNRDRRKIKEGGIAFDIAIPNWPVLSLSYSHGSSSTIKRVDGSDSKLESIQTFGAYISYKFNPKWKISLSSYYTMNEDINKSDVTGSYLSSKLKSEFNPTKSISIIPSVGLSRNEYRYPGGGGGSRTPTGSFLFSYSHPSKIVEFISYAEYALKWRSTASRLMGRRNSQDLANFSGILRKQNLEFTNYLLNLGTRNLKVAFMRVSTVIAYRFAPLTKYELEKKKHS